MNADAAAILAHLRVVDEERERRASSLDLATRVEAIKAHQQRRFSMTYDDLLSSPRYAGAAHFFLAELYGPGDFSQRDTQFARVVPALVRVFPKGVTQTVATLAQLHAVTEALDSRMAAHIGPQPLDDTGYANAWRMIGCAAEREQQIALALSVGESLDRLTRNTVLSTSLRMMRGPAARAGLAELQAFLERGFAVFRTMGGASEFLSVIGQRERDLAQQLFASASAYASGRGILS